MRGFKTILFLLVLFSLVAFKMNAEEPHIFPIKTNFSIGCVDSIFATKNDKLEWQQETPKETIKRTSVKTEEDEKYESIEFTMTNVVKILITFALYCLLLGVVVLFGYVLYYLVVLYQNFF